MKNRLLPSLLLVLLPSRPSGGEDIRGLVVEEILLQSDTGFEQTAGVSFEELAAVYLEENTRFLKAVRIELLLSNTLKQFFDSASLVIYKSVSPPPRKGQRSFAGKRILLAALPYLNRTYVTIPIRAPGAEGPVPAGTLVLEEPVQASEFPLLVGIVPVFKGIPDAVLESKFFFTFKPSLEKKGILELSLLFPPGREAEQVEVFIDDKKLGPPFGSREMEAGLHQLKIASPAFKEVSASFTIESGKTSRVEISLEETTTQMILEAPDGAEIYLDGEKIPYPARKRYPLREGSHLVSIKIGNYSLSKRFTVKQGKDYHLSCVFDIIIEEE